MTRTDPRLVETMEELDLLPQGSVIRTTDDWVTYEHFGRRQHRETGEYYTVWGAAGEGGLRGEHAPAWVLWEGLAPGEEPYYQTGGGSHEKLRNDS